MLSTSTPALRKAAHRIEFFSSIPSGSVGAELGVFAGDFTEAICEACKPSCIYAVDFWSGMQTSGDVNGENYRTLDISSIRAEKTKCWAGSPIKIVPSSTDAWLWSQPIGMLDWVYLDSDHSYEHVANELAAARYAVKAGGLLMGHDFDAYEFPGVVRAVREFAQRWGCQIYVTTNDKLATYAMYNPERETRSRICGTILQVGIGDRDDELLDYAGKDIAAWAAKFGWNYIEKRENAFPSRSPIWSKLFWELALWKDYEAIFTLDADVMLIDSSVSPSAAFDCPGIGVARLGQGGGSPHFNCGVRAVHTGHLLAEPMITAAWLAHDRVRDHPWSEQKALHDLQLHFPDVMYPISPRWNFNFCDRHKLGCEHPVILSYHGTDNRLQRMKADRLLIDQSKPIQQISVT